VTSRSPKLEWPASELLGLRLVLRPLAARHSSGHQLVALDLGRGRCIANTPTYEGIQALIAARTVAYFCYPSTC
jgi:hypothetical protein